MVKLEGIIYKVFESYVVLRGFAPLKDLAAISHSSESYQRNANKEHLKEIINFLDSGEYKYFPEITLACRVKHYSDFALSIGVDNPVNWYNAQFVEGLQVLIEKSYTAYGNYRAPHANLTKTTNDLVRVDGNHRLAPFDDENKEIWEKTKANKKDLGDLVVPFTVIFSSKDEEDKNKEIGESFEAGIFHNINFRQLPLREEASLRIISELKSFVNLDKFGVAYPLAMELIKEVRNGLFDSIHWLKVDKDKYGKEDTDKSYFRTACLRIAQLLISQKDKIAKSLKKSQITIKDDVAKQKEKIEDYKKQIKEKKNEIKQIEINNADFAHMSLYKEAQFEYEELESKLSLFQNQQDILVQQLKHEEYKIVLLTDYVNKCNDKNAIISVLTELTNIYKDFGDNYGNISLLCALVYYSLLDKGQLFSFVNWVKRNGINKITDPDDLSKDASLNLITMFDQIYQAKKNEVFVSMQFGDSQSELIYEKIMRAIEIFNKKNSNIQLNLYPIRIDRTIEQSTYSIQDKILEAIQDCSLIIADLSSHNINVYHEIGYAMGIAKSNNDMLPNMILLYKENSDHNKDNIDVDKFIGFNLRNLSQLRFKDYDQLVDGLVKRLEKHYGV